MTHFFSFDRKPTAIVHTHACMHALSTPAFT